jgi:hypothetical protein
MSYDLYFCKRNPIDLPFDEVVAWSRQYFAFQRTSEVQLSYQNEDTGVYFCLEWTPSADRGEIDIPPGLFDTGLAFNLNYVRPTFFALEAMSIAAALACQFDLLMFDPQREPSVGEFGADELVKSWSKSNEWAVGVVATKDSSSLIYLTADSSREFWSYMREYPGLKRDLAGPDVFVPRQLLLSLQDPQRAETAFVWTLGVHLIIPRTDWIVVVFPKRFWQRKNEMLCFKSETVLARISQYLREYDGARGIRVLPPENLTAADKVLKELEGGLDLREVKRISPDSCVDVPFGRFKPN